MVEKITNKKNRLLQNHGKFAEMCFNVPITTQVVFFFKRKILFSSKFCVRHTKPAKVNKEKRNTKAAPIKNETPKPNSKATKQTKTKNSSPPKKHNTNSFQN